jgi:hypothetical protein
LRFAKSNDLVTRLVLASLFEQLDTLKAFQNVAFGSDGTGAFEASMLGHKNKKGPYTVQSGPPVSRVEFSDLPQRLPAGAVCF